MLANLPIPIHNIILQEMRVDTVKFHFHFSVAHVAV